MAQKTDISFIPNLTTMECFKLIGKALWTIIKNTGRAINKAVYRCHAWCFHHKLHKHSRSKKRA